MKLFRKPLLSNPLIIIVIIIGIAMWIHMSDLAQWAVRLSLCALFCTLIYFRDDASNDRWVAIGIIAAGTLLSLLWSGF